MPDPNEADSVNELRDRIRQLESAVALATSAAASAEKEQGRLQGELTRVTDLWAAATLHRDEWDVLFSENVEGLRLANEHLVDARRARTEIEQSTTWRLIQTVLAPYRRLRGLR